MFYIGQSSNMQRRVQQHKNAALFGIRKEEWDADVEVCVLHGGIGAPRQANRLERREIVRHDAVRTGLNKLGGAPGLQGLILGNR